MSEKDESGRSKVDLPGPTVVGKIDNIDRDREGQRDNSQSSSSEDPEAGDHGEDNPEWGIDADVQLNPWPDLARVFPEGSFHVAEITRFNAPHGGSLSTRLKFGVEGVIPRKELIKGYRRDKNGEKNATNLEKEYDEGQKLACSVKRFDGENKFIQLSETRKFSVEDEQAYLTEEWKAYARAYPHGQDVKGVVVDFDHPKTASVMLPLGVVATLPQSHIPTDYDNGLAAIDRNDVMNLYVHHFSLEKKQIILNAKEDPIDRNVIRVDKFEKRYRQEEKEWKGDIKVELEGAKEISKEIKSFKKAYKKKLNKKTERETKIDKKKEKEVDVNIVRVDSEKGRCELMLDEGKIKFGNRGMGRLEEIEDPKNIVGRYIDSLNTGKDKSKDVSDALNAELQLLGQLNPGDLITVTSGADQIVAVGIIAEPGYEWVGGEDQSHCIHVDWKAEIDRSIPIQTGWPNRMIHPIKPEVFRRIVEDDWPTSTPYTPPSFEEIVVSVWEEGMSINERTLRRYHQSLETGKFVILSGLSGTGKTWLTELYANTVGAKRLCQPVSPNWNTDEDLLGYHNPVEGRYHHTDTSRFLQSAEREYRSANASNRKPRPYHLVLDEMNLARVEYYFAKLLSKMEERKRQGAATLELGPQTEIQLTPNLFVVGTVNIDETTHEFADKVYDRAQLIEMKAPREQLLEEIEDAPYSEIVVDVWDAVSEVAPFGFRVLNEIQEYIGSAPNHGGEWKEALDEQLLQKVLVKVKGTKPEVKESLEQFMDAVPEDAFPLSHHKAEKMLKSYEDHGFASYF